MKCLKSYFSCWVPFLFVIFSILFIPNNTYAQTISNTGVTLKNANNTAVLYQGGVNLDNTAIAYTTGKVEFPFSTSVAYDSSYSFTMDYYFNVPYTSDYTTFGWGNPELYINSNGLVQQTLQISQFSNTLQACNALACTYRLNLAFTFATNAGGTLYLAIPVSPPHNIYGWHYNNIDLTSYGANTSNSDIINNNNQNTQNIINNQNNNTQQIINSNNQINNSINNDDTTDATNDGIDFFDNFTDTADTHPANILTLPLSFVRQLNQTCQPINLSIPHFGNLSIPCIQSYLSQFLPTALLDLVKLIVNGILMYKILLSIVDFIQKLKDPNDDELEVIDL